MTPSRSARMTTEEIAEVMPPLEQHFTPKDLGKLWGFSEDKIRSMFQDVPGVLKVGTPFRRGRRGYVSLRIPQSVATRIHRELSE